MNESKIVIKDFNINILILNFKVELKGIQPKIKRIWNQITKEF